MNLRRLLLASLVVCRLASAATCTKDFSPGYEPGFLSGMYWARFPPGIHIVVRTNDLTIEYTFDDPIIELFIDGESVQRLDLTTAAAEISSLCGAGFLFPDSRQSSVRENRLSPPRVKSLATA